MGGGRRLDGARPGSRLPPPRRGRALEAHRDVETAVRMLLGVHAFSGP
ncbi:hypothetical protein [Nonomuraea gerenzanensis]|uniref:Uncharacterized protein n=1 Tax=Nonomuraea gerenzanensis TaxID=93944 RepID=A0A1M4EBC3_9ACTN|nr:hypothetical protein [Nonomuraea gerenzanensis]UBU18251.1 hypothetical protein LCN96_25460 [Nonomuraea gerenzanensis]SBO96066.1 hypothetical protein BN4615_P5582 [Nonomuraea gerenzanensis]